MKVLIQRVKQASVSVDSEIVGQIDAGLLVFAAIEEHDDEQSVQKMSDKILNYRVFPDELGKMNLSVYRVYLDLLIVSQFTLAADTKKGLRPSFASAASPEKARKLFDHFVKYTRKSELKVETGVFAADMQVSLVNDGPVTFLLKN